MREVGTETVQERAETQAAERFSLIRSGEASEADRAEIAAWRAADPGNEAAWARISAVWSHSEAAALDPEIYAMRTAALKRIAKPAPRPVQNWRPFALAASLVIAIGGTAWFGSGQQLPWGDPEIAEANGAPWSPETRTRVGQIQSLRLEDGSAVTVNTDSALRTAISATARRVQLSRGEAYFKVARDPARPFSVGTGDVTVTAVGTAFSVRNTGDAVIVTLAEGRVHVVSADRKQEVDLTPGLQLVADASGLRTTKVDAARVTSWTSGTLAFDQTPLGTVIAEMNRYAERQVTLAEPGLARQPITGVFPAGEQDRFLAMLVATGKVRVSRRTSSSVELSAP